MVDREIYVILGYLAQLLKSYGGRVALLKEIGEWLESNQILLGPAQEKLDTLITDTSAEGGSNKLDRKQAATFREGVIGLIEERRQRLLPCKPSRLHRNLQLLSRHLGLSPLESDFVGLAARHLSFRPFRRFFDDVCSGHLDTMDACACVMGVETEDLLKALQSNGSLLGCGVIQEKKATGSDLDDHFRINDLVLDALRRCQSGIDELLPMVLGHAAKPALEWTDFAHLGPVAEKSCTFLRHALQRQQPGVNILLWGPPGTGKTEFCKTLAKQIGTCLYPVGEQDPDGQEPSRGERLISYRLAQALLKSHPDAILLFDEMDDLCDGIGLGRLFGVKPRMGSKVFINRLVENNPVPTLWVINDIDSLDEAFIRRMSLVLDVKLPPTQRREQIWHRILAKNEIELPVDEVRRMAELNVPPAVIESAARFSRQTGGQVEDFRLDAEGIIKAMRRGRPLPRVEEQEKFLPELTCADLELGCLTEQLSRAQNRAFSLCIYGPPGTGKSAYLRYLADQMRLSIVQKRASDLLDMFVGGSEKKIAAAFQEAIEKEAFLIFDEADSLLRNRRNAVNGWEVSQVNEMLTWMERHPLPFACTTNLMDSLDPASMRRFTFKCCFGYMKLEQILEAFRHFFRMEMPVPPRGEMPRLTPGDFSVVQKKAQLLGLLDQPEKLRNLLIDEASENGGMEAERRIGFGIG